MKKNRTMRAAALLLALTLMTSCFVGGTFAKYTTSDSATDTARVAKWGVTVLASGNLFGKDYNPNSAGADGDKICAATSDSVSAGTNVVAPGTLNNTGLTISITGTPEVSWTVETATADTNNEIYLGVGYWGVLVKATGLNAATDTTKYYWEDGSGNYVQASGAYDSGKTYYEMHDKVQITTDPYYPVKWTAASNGLIATTKSRLGELMSEMAGNLTGVSGEPNDSIDLSYTLTWEWPIDGNDAADTILGNLKAGSAVVFSEGGTAYAEPAANADPASGNYWTEINVNFSLTVSQTN